MGLWEDFKSMDLDPWNPRWIWAKFKFNSFNLSKQRIWIWTHSNPNLCHSNRPLVHFKCIKSFINPNKCNLQNYFSQFINPNKHIQDIHEKKMLKPTWPRERLRLGLSNFQFKVPNLISQAPIQGEYKNPYPEIMQSKTIRNKN